MNLEIKISYIEQIDLFITLFHGRTDVYAKRIISKAGYLQGQWD